MDAPAHPPPRPRSSPSASRSFLALESLAFGERPLRWICAVVLSAALATLIGRPPAYDDAWFLEQAWFVANEGQLRSELFRGMLGWEQWVYITQKAGVLLTALFVRLLGPVPLAAQIPGLLYAIVCNIVLVAWLRRVRPGDRTTVLVATTLLWANGAFVDFAFLVRPEPIVAALALASCGALQGVFVPHWRPLASAALAGALAGATPLFHLNGAMVIAAGGLVLVLQRQWSRAVAYSIAALAVASLYVVDAVVRGDLAWMVHQFRFDPATAGSTSLVDKLATIARVHKIFLHGPAQITMTGALLLAAFVFRRDRETTENASTNDPVRGLLRHAGVLLVVFVVLLNRPAHMYALLFCPFAMAAFAVAHVRARAPDRAGLRRVVAVLFVVAVGAGIGHHVRLVVENANARDELRHNEAIAGRLPKRNVAVVAPVHFVYGQLPHFRILGLAKYAFVDRTTNRPWDLTSLADDAARHDVEYLVFERRRGYHNFDPPEHPEVVGAYERFVYEPPLVIYRRVH